MRLLAGVGCDGARAEWLALAGGANNTVLLVRDGAREVVLKHYRRDANDTRDRLGAEVTLLRYAQLVAPGYTPELLALDESAGVTILSYIPGDAATARDATAANVARAGAFLRALNAPQHLPATAAFGTASEAAFSISDHIALIEDRIGALDRESDPTPATASQAREILDTLHRGWDATRASIDHALASGRVADALPAEGRIISPSDFGFHNARFDQDGMLRFFDFEYAGWDDPAKTLADFFLQPRIPVDHSWRAAFLAAGPSLHPALTDRAEILMPLFAVKWACIVLKSLIPAQRARRLQIYPGASIDELLIAQMDLASGILAKLSVAPT